MAKWEIAIWGKDEADNGAHKRIKEGDIIATKAYPATWGPQALKKCLIVIVDGFTEEEIEGLKKPLYANEKDMADALDPDIIVTPVAKRRYMIPLSILNDGWLTLDSSKVRDNKVAYQPFKKKSEVEAGCGDQLVADCGITLDAEKEVDIDATEKVAVYYDKFTEAYNNPTIKTK